MSRPKNFLETTKNKFICSYVKALLGNKVVQNTFSCAFPILRSIFQKIWIRLQDEVLLGSRNIRSPRPIFFEILVAAKTKLPLGRRNLWRPRQNSSWWKIQSFWKMLKKNRKCTMKRILHYLNIISWPPLPKLAVKFFCHSGWVVGWQRVRLG